ncbi:MAG: methylenetetrahydrofolate reductase [Candidatus Thorarchaeota archaeon]|jgi:5,10-methylenetetrahydrofolate reductase
MQETHLKQLLDRGDFAVTCEIGAPHGADSSLLIERIEIVRNYCDAINVPDNARGVPAMSSTVCAQYVLQARAEPVLHLTTRDRNLISLQSELYGAYALGVRNILLMAGDHTRFGTHPHAKMVNDLNTLEALGLAQHLATGFDSVGDELEGTPEFYLGATVNPNDHSMDDQIRRMQKKHDAGAQFFQTQAIFDTAQLMRFMKNIDADINVLVGVIPLRDSEMAQFMNDYVPGVHVSVELIKRFEDVSASHSDEETKIEAMKAEGIQIALETIEVVREIDGVDGLHLMGVGWAESIVELVKLAGLHPRPKTKR